MMLQNNNKKSEIKQAEKLIEKLIRKKYINQILNDSSFTGGENIEEKVLMNYILDDMILELKESGVFDQIVKNYLRSDERKAIAFRL